MSRRQKPVIDSSIPPADLPLRPSVRFRLAKGDTFFGPGVAEFLILVDQSNSMQTACKEMEMSYSKGWKIIKKAEQLSRLFPDRIQIRRRVRRFLPSDTGGEGAAHPVSEYGKRAESSNCPAL